MRPYWITITRHPRPTPLNLGAGITANSVSDARLLFEAAFGAQFQIEAINPIEDMRNIEQKHVAPNMGNWSKRGIWFPLGYDQVAI